ncbi:MAG: ribbon-helix-helix protein, CopG family [Bryobacteraceae bacterium]|nr:ribbon-helix-helix protein, CopG family [Bryobacteraceae bacterium]
MKTAISVDDALMDEADQAARDLGLSRSALIAEALRAYLRLRKQAQTTAALDAAHAGEPDADERLLVRLLRARLPLQDEW